MPSFSWIGVGSSVVCQPLRPIWGVIFNCDSIVLSVHRWFRGSCVGIWIKSSVALRLWEDIFLSSGFADAAFCPVSQHRRWIICEMASKKRGHELRLTDLIRNEPPSVCNVFLLFHPPLASTSRFFFSSLQVFEEASLPPSLLLFLHCSNQPLTHSRELITSPLIYVGVTHPPIKAISEYLIDHGYSQAGGGGWGCGWGGCYPDTDWYQYVSQEQRWAEPLSTNGETRGMTKPKNPLLPRMGVGLSTSW